MGDGWFPQQPQCIQPHTTLGNICQGQPALSQDQSGVLGTTIFVWTDCATNAVLENDPNHPQDPAYKPDVRLPQSVVASALGASPGPNNPNLDGPADGECPRGGPNTYKCW